MPATARALGFEGFALMKLGRDADAFERLSRAHALAVGGAGGPADARRRRRERSAVSRALAVCCRRLGVAAPLPPIAKFPRTAHLFDAGGTAVTSDDLVLGDTARFLLELDASEARAVVIEEKLDGGNIGISRGLDGELLVQNRSHYISSGDHPQYRPLFHTWLREPARRAALEALLPPGGDVILFGEWLLARHSVPYLALPDHFVAFDVYDRRTEKFWSRPRFHAAMRANVEHPALVTAIHTEYVAAGCDVLTTNAFTITPSEAPDDLASMLHAACRCASDAAKAEHAESAMRVR